MKLPLTRGECVDAIRPCPHSSCRYHLTHSRTSDSCALDFADRISDRDESDGPVRAPHKHAIGGKMLRGASEQEVADALGCTPQYIGQIERAALQKFAQRYSQTDGELLQRALERAARVASQRLQPDHGAFVIAEDNIVRLNVA